MDYDCYTHIQIFFLRFTSPWQVLWHPEIHPGRLPKMDEAGTTGWWMSFPTCSHLNKIGMLEVDVANIFPLIYIYIYMHVYIYIYKWEDIGYINL